MDLRGAANPARWGDPDTAVPLPDTVREMLSAALGIRRKPTPAVTVTLPPNGLTPDTIAALRAVCQDLSTDDRARLAHAIGKSTVDLLRIRAGEACDAPDAVGCPASHDEVLALLRVCAE